LQESIENLCQKYTNLRKEEIAYIEQVSGALKFLADTENADVFINCPCVRGDTIIVAQAKPDIVDSGYKSCVVGMFSRPANEPAVARTARLGVPTNRVMAYNQEGARVIQVCQPINYKDRTIGVLTYERQSLEQEAGKRFQAEAKAGKEFSAFKDTKGKLKEWTWLLEGISGEAIILVDRNRFIVFRNNAAKELFRKMGYICDILGQDYRNVRLQKTDLFDSDYEVEFEAGNYFLRERLIEIQKEDIAFMVFLTDITESKNQERELILKSIAVKEMHHRIKNSLQMIVSLISLQIRRSESRETKEALQEISSRIRTIVLTHQMLEQSDAVDKTSLKKVISIIAGNVMRIGSPYYKVSLYVSGDDFEADSDMATTVALIVNELIMNSMEHAFKGLAGGEIRINIEREGVSYCQITVADNGKGYGKNNKRHLGSSIIQMLVKSKLRGTLTIETGEAGTIVRFGFPL